MVHVVARTEAVTDEDTGTANEVRCGVSELPLVAPQKVHSRASRGVSLVRHLPLRAGLLHQQPRIQGKLQGAHSPH